MRNAIRAGTMGLILAIVALTGCAAGGAYVQHPGTVSVTSSQAYDTLVAADAVIKQAKIDYPSFPAAWRPNVKVALNTAIKAYDIANVSWTAYNATGTAADLASMNQNLISLSSALSGLTTAKAGQ